MEDQAEYKVKERPFHGDYLQGKNPRQYQNSAIILTYIFGVFGTITAIFGVYKVVECVIDFVKNWL